MDTITLEAKMHMSLDDIPSDRAPKSGSAGGKIPRRAASKRRSGPSGTETSTAKVYVGNLGFDVSWQDLKDKFAEVGPVAFAEVASRENGKSKGWGTVEFSSVKDAKRAIAQLNGKSFEGRDLIVRADRDASGSTPKKAGNKAAKPGNKSRTTVYVGNLSYETTWQGLKTLMRRAGNVSHVEVAQRPNGQSKGWGTVEFADVKSANRAIKTLNESELDGRTIFVRFDKNGDGVSEARSNSSSSSSSGTRVHVGSLSFDTTWQQLKDFMKQAGRVVRADITTRPNGTSRGWGLVEFETAKGAKRACNQLNGKTLDGREITVKPDSGDKATSSTAPPAKSSTSAAPGKRVYIGNIPWTIHWQDLKDYLRSKVNGSPICHNAAKIPQHLLVSNNISVL